MRKLLALAITLMAFSGPTTWAQETASNFNLWEEEAGDGAVGIRQDPVPPGMTLEKLVVLTSDQDSDKAHLSLMIDGQRKISGMYNLPDPNNKKNEGGSKSIYWLRDIESPNGSVMLVKKGRNILILQGKLDERTQEGTFVIKYLTNGIFMRYDSCEFELKKKDNGWFIENSYTGEPVSEIKVITHSLGVTTLEGLCE